MTDKLSDMVARINNSQKRGLLEVLVLRNKLCELVLDCLVNEGYIRGYVFCGQYIKVLLKYKYGVGVIKELKRISRPGFRQYYSAETLRKKYLRNERVIFTSSSGVFLNNMKEIGGEALIRIS